MDTLYTFEQLDQMLVDADASIMTIHPETVSSISTFYLVRQREMIVAVGLNGGKVTLRPGDSLIVKENGEVKLKPGENSYNDPVKKIFRKYDIPFKFLRINAEPIKVNKSFLVSNSTPTIFTHHGEFCVVLGYFERTTRRTHSINDTDIHQHFWVETINKGDVVIIITRNPKIDRPRVKIIHDLYLVQVTVRPGIDDHKAATFLDNVFGQQIPLIDVSETLRFRTMKHEEIALASRDALLKMERFLNTPWLNDYLLDKSASNNYPSDRNIADAIFRLWGTVIPDSAEGRLLTKAIGYYPYNNRFGFFIIPPNSDNRLTVETVPFIKGDELFKLLEEGHAPWSIPLARGERIIMDLFRNGDLEKWAEMLENQYKKN